MSVPAPISAKVQGDTTKGSTSSSASTMLSLTSTPASALYNFRLLEALRSDDPRRVQPFLDELQPSTMSADGMEDAAKIGKVLGMAVRVASVPIVSQIITSPSVSSPNLPVTLGSFTTALHVASQTGRSDVVELLLNHPRINDTIRDEQGRTALECAGNHEVAAAIEESRGTLQVRYIAQLSSYVASPLSSVEESMAMVEFLEGPRTEILNLNALDEKSGTSLLHEAARRRDMRLVELAVKRGADIFVRDRMGRRVLDGEKGADDRIKAFLRQFHDQDSVVQSKSDGRPPDLRGFLSKWVNYRSGWKTRWFVLENGVLSYYRNREDEAVACRGSIAMAVATLHPSHDGSRFEVHSKVSSSVPKFIVKSAHRAEVTRWIQTVKLNIDFYSQGGKPAPPPAEKAALSRRPTSMNISSMPEKSLSSSIASLPPADTFLSPKLARTATGLSGISLSSPVDGSGRRLPLPSGDPGTDGLTDGGDTISLFDAADKDSLVGSGEQQTGSYGIPHDQSFDLGVLNIKAQIDLTQQLIDSTLTPPTSTNASPDRSAPRLARTSSWQQAVKDALRSSLTTLGTLVSQQNIMSQDRERYLLGRIHREVEARKLWEENLMTVAQQQADMDRQLNAAARDNEKKRKALRQAKGVLAGLSSGGSLPLSPAGGEMSPPAAPPSSIGPGILDVALGSATTGTMSPGMTSAMSPGGFHRGSISNIQEAHDAVVAAGAGSDSEDGDDDEFFDAIEQNTIPNLKLYDSIAYPAKERPGTPVGEKQTPVLDAKQPPRGTIQDLLARKSLEPYMHVREKLPIDDDKRPAVSLWSILKSSVGKDLTRISFPVAFNECTSMLQRMAEDMEYDACLTVAAEIEDSLKRIAFVGAFAMSNYSSTIGRIAKPFNPLLSQSFEYAIPHRYRYISEQVSHHPPISACYCEAPKWKYFGEVDAQNKFQGRSFEIRPTGVAHATLIIPKKWVKPEQQYPDAGPEYREGLVVEHYSWKKVTTNVSGFITGSPIIDHYGDLVVTNHRTGETCTLTFKPRSWRGKDAFEIKGSVTDASGRSVWDIAGRWDSQLIARQAGSSAPLDVNTEFKPSQKEYLLLWRNSEKPKAPFNLTPFACTLNDIPNGLKPYLAPTDCRLRTDQRAFENAEYERAQELKTLNEEMQRNTRKARAEGRLPPHEARWFSSSMDPDSGERLWEPRRTDTGEVLFWAEREKAGQEGQWEGIDHIFAE